MKLIKINGVWYKVLMMSGGYSYLSGVFDVNNNVKKSGVLWEMGPHFYSDEFWYGGIMSSCVNLIRYFKKSKL